MEAMEQSDLLQNETRQLSVADDLLDLYDQVAEFNDCCAFLCDAFCSLAAEEHALETSTIEGLKCFSYWIQQRMLHVKERLGVIHERASATSDG